MVEDLDMVQHAKVACLRSRLAQARQNRQRFLIEGVATCGDLILDNHQYVFRRQLLTWFNNVQQVLLKVDHEGFHLSGTHSRFSRQLSADSTRVLMGL